MKLKEMKARLRAIHAEAEKETDTEVLNKLLAEAEELNAKIEEAQNRERLRQLAGSAAESDEGQPNGNNGEDGEDVKDKAAKRGKTLMAGGKVSRVFATRNTLTSSQTVLKQHAAEDVKDTFNEVSSLVDMVKMIPLPGGESYKRGFVKSYGEGGYTVERADYTAAEPTFGYASMTKAKITAYCEEPEEIQKLAPAAYDGIIEDSIDIAIRKKLSKQILIGTGGDNSLTGIFFNPSSASDDIIDRNTDVELSAIDENTLDTIIYGYGGNEDVESVAVLILNKADLKAFATCRLSDGKKAYTVVNHGNTGTIDGVPYIINSACKAVSNSTTTAGSYCMAYGSLLNYEMPVFSDIDIQHSNEYKFKQGQIAHRGDIFVGGNVAAKNGFLRVKKKQ